VIEVCADDDVLIAQRRIPAAQERDDVLRGPRRGAPHVRILRGESIERLKVARRQLSQAE
jgi:hypothetical protein